MRSVMRAAGALWGRCAPRIVNNKSIAHLSFGLEGNKFFGGRDPLFQSKWTDQSPASPGASSLASWVVVVVLGRRECGKCTPSPFSSLISSSVSYLLYLLISFPLPAPSKSPFVCFSSFLAPVPLPSEFFALFSCDFTTAPTSLSGAAL